VPWLVEKADAVLAAWFLGSEAGNAIADVVMGRCIPERAHTGELGARRGAGSLFFGERPSGRPADPSDHYTSKYLDVPNDPLFPFGHGLTYGHFTLSNLR
jgi:beta-glucosidase